MKKIRCKCWRPVIAIPVALAAGSACSAPVNADARMAAVASAAAGTEASVPAAPSAPVTGDPLAAAERLFRAGRFDEAASAAARLDSASHQDEFRALMLRSRSALARGRGRDAVALLEQVTRTYGEQPDAEVALIRAYLQAGDFAHAVAWSTVVAGENPDLLEARALRAYLLDRAGYTDIALGQLAEARERYPDDPALIAAQAEIRIERGSAPRATIELDDWLAHHPAHADVLRVRARAASAGGDAAAEMFWLQRAAKAREKAADDGRTNWPAPGFEAFDLPAEHRYETGSGVLFDDGRRVLSHADVVAGTRSQVVWVRTGLGELRRARVERVDAAIGLATLRLEVPLFGAPCLSSADVVDAPPGSAVFVIGFPVASQFTTTYPALSPGLLFRKDVASTGLLQLTTWLGPNARGAPVLDLAGHLLGLAAGRGQDIVAAREAGLDRGMFAVGPAAIRALLAEAGGGAATCVPPRATTAMDQSRDALYEHMLGAVVQLVAPAR